jgi:hypothetical protein
VVAAHHLQSSASTAHFRHESVSQSVSVSVRLRLVTHAQTRQSRQGDQTHGLVLLYPSSPRPCHGCARRITITLSIAHRALVQQPPTAVQSAHPYTGLRRLRHLSLEAGPRQVPGSVGTVYLVHLTTRYLRTGWQVVRY